MGIGSVGTFSITKLYMGVCGDDSCNTKILSMVELKSLLWLARKVYYRNNNIGSHSSTLVMLEKSTNAY